MRGHICPPIYWGHTAPLRGDGGSCRYVNWSLILYIQFWQNKRDSRKHMRGHICPLRACCYPLWGSWVLYVRKLFPDFIYTLLAKQGGFSQTHERSYLPSEGHTATPSEVRLYLAAVGGLLYCYPLYLSIGLVGKK
jgi:hypothetical protein